MILDANILLFARDVESPFNVRARAWLTDRLNGETRVGLPWPSLVAFVRIATHPRVYERPLSPGDAWQQVEEWLAAKVAWIPAPGEAYAQILGRLIQTHGVGGNLVSDAALAALAIEHGVTLASADTDFARFSDLSWVNPLESRPRRRK